jgi:hypothetical protein
MRRKSRTSRNDLARRCRQCWARLESLENRILLTDFRWSNPSGGDWDTATNWSPVGIPGATDTAAIDMPNITVTHSLGRNDSVLSIDSQAPLSIGSGSLSIADASTLRNLNLHAGTLTGAGDVSVTQSLTWTAGTMSGTGTTTVATGGTLQLSGQLTLNGRTLANDGTANWSGAGQFDAISLSNGAVIDNQAGATFVIANDRAIAATASGQGTFRNEGTLVKSGGTAQSYLINVNLSNAGTVKVQTGRLTLQDNGDSTGAFQVASGATIGFGNNGQGGTQTLESVSRITGSGTVVIIGGTVSLGGQYDLGTEGITSVNSGAVHFLGAVSSLGKDLIIGGGTADFHTGVPISVPEIDFSSGTLTGTDSLSVGQTLNWTGGKMTGVGATTVLAGAALNLSGQIILDGWTLRNAGLATWTGNANFALSNGAAIDNLVGATFMIATDEAIAQGNIVQDPSSFHNAGTLVKSAGTGTSSIENVELDNTGIFRLDSGSLAIVNGQKGLVIDGSGVLEGQPGTTLFLGNGLGDGSLLGATRDTDRYAPPPLVAFVGTDNPTASQQLEAMGQDLGNTALGFSRNFAYDTLEIGIPQNAVMVQVVDDSDNAPGSSAEAVYVNTLIVAAGSTLDLHGLHL